MKVSINNLVAKLRETKAAAIAGNVCKYVKAGKYRE